MALSATFILLAACALGALGGDLAQDPFLRMTLEQLLRNSAEAGFARPRRLSSGTTVIRSCAYPGTVAFTFTGLVLCMGIRQPGDIALVTNYCADTVQPLAAKGFVQVQGGNGSSIVTLSSLTVTDNGDGTKSLSPIPAFSSSSCPSDFATVYDSSMNIDVSTCEIVSYGSTTATIGSFGSLTSIPLLTNPFVSCCEVLQTNILQHANLGEKATSNSDWYTCARTSAGICGGDIGAPIFCNDTTDNKVVTGLVSSGECNADSITTFMAVDLTDDAVAGFSI